MDENQTSQSPKSNNSMIAIALIVLLIIGAGAFLLVKKTKNSGVNVNVNNNIQVSPTAVQQSPTAVPTQASPSGAMNASVKEVTVTASNFSFSPKEIRVKKGDRVKVTLTNQGGTHDFGIDEFNAKTKRIGAGETDTVQFTADKTGTFEYYCSVGNHRAMGMVGKLIVE